MKTDGSTEKIILAGDIGGTKTTLGLFKAASGSRKPIVEATFPSASYSGLEEITKTFLTQVRAGGLGLRVACFGVAGPVIGEKAKITNLPWMVDAKVFCEALGFTAIHLMNDLEAVANAVPVLEPADLYTLNEKQPAVGGTIGVLAPGTGLGEAFLVWDGVTYRAYPSEGGHCSFAPRNPLESDLLRYLLERFEHVSYERVCSGRGMPNLYAFFLEKELMTELPEVAVQLASAGDPTPVIVRAGLDPEKPSPICRRVLEIFVSILGAEAGNLALKVMATGGIYLGGGIPPRILSVLQAGGFMQTFQHKGRFGSMVGQIPVHVILNSKAALFGAARKGLQSIL
jgi:glucokinase